MTRSSLAGTRTAVVGVDVGGSTCAAGVVSADGEILLEEQLPTHHQGPDTAGRTIVELLERVTRRAAEGRIRLAGIGLGVPGVVDATGRVGEAHHVRDLEGVALGQSLGTTFGVPTFVDNDVNALALAEWRFGAGRGSSSIVVLAPGTGFGAGIVLEGRLVRGVRGFGGELGHAPVKFDGRPCWCGGRGCLSLYASGRGISEAAQALAATEAGASLLAATGGDPGAITAPFVFAAAEAGDPAASAVIDQACRALGAAIAIVVNGLNPEVVVVTGGVAGAFARCERQVRAAAAEHAFARALAGTRVVIVPGDKRVTMRGAAALALYELERSAAHGARGRPRSRKGAPRARKKVP